MIWRYQMVNKEDEFYEWLNECPVQWFRNGKPSDWNYTFIVDNE